ncbi:hypothetical protein PHMEG_0003782 [Phytophthora megakarya]|uniref:Uncharacterized protein n=1 Tax=Phytophthora megakarya TaxID=4795 RepID=A0A225WX15_9STRA|nr:hypothetical protein PHMEG_00025262 [Phytophthora megakarya]OWZ21627.1 hypothetical protein PHMEG_0003782 [Phytophthora megakarya]
MENGLDLVRDVLNVRPYAKHGTVAAHCQDVADHVNEH